MRTLTRTLLVAWPLTLVMSAACVTEAVGPDDGEEGTPSDELPADAPQLPVPVGPLADVAATSDTLTVMEPLATNFRPRVTDARGSWDLEARQCLIAGPFQCGGWYPWESFPTVSSTWSDEIPSQRFDATGDLIPMAFSGLGRILVFENGSAATPGLLRYIGSGTVGGDDYETRKDFLPLVLSETVYLRRDRYWVRQQLSSGVGEYLLVTGNTEASLSTTYSSGTSRTETEEFGRSVTATAGLSYGPLSASVSGTLSQSYSTTVEVREETSETFTRTVRGTPGKQTRFMVWALTERYTFTDANGDPFTDPNYELVLDEILYRHGVATALQATEFPLN